MRTPYDTFSNLDPLILVPFIMYFLFAFKSYRELTSTVQKLKGSPASLTYEIHHLIWAPF